MVHDKHAGVASTTLTTPPLDRGKERFLDLDAVIDVKVLGRNSAISHH